MYGIDITPEDPKYVPLLHEALEGPTEGLMAGSFLVEHIPALQYVPAWVPGAGFQKKFARWRRLAGDLLNLPFADAKQAWLRGEGYHSAVHEMLEDISRADLSEELAADEERVAKIGAANSYAAGADTVSPWLTILLLWLMPPSDFLDTTVLLHGDGDASRGPKESPGRAGRGRRTRQAPGAQRSGTSALCERRMQGGTALEECPPIRRRA